jgi:translation elongation factor EF-Tu-like GTPase
MGLWPFGRKEARDPGDSGDPGDMDVDHLLAEANAASPTGRFTMPVEDVFTIAGRGVVATGRVQTGVATVGQPVSVVRDGALVVATKVNAIEKFRAVTDSASVGENVGLLLDALSRDQVMSGDLIQG